jgi:hypothetical protein
MTVMAMLEFQGIIHINTAASHIAEAVGHAVPQV